MESEYLGFKILLLVLPISDEFIQILEEVKKFSKLKQSKRVKECHTNLPPKKIIHHSKIQHKKIKTPLSKTCNKNY